jgi:hypothetical protein
MKDPPEGKRLTTEGTKGRGSGKKKQHRDRVTERREKKRTRSQRGEEEE